LPKTTSNFGFLDLFRLVNEHYRDIVTNLEEKEAVFAQQPLLALQLQCPFALGAGEYIQQLFTDHGFHLLNEKECAASATSVARSGPLHKKTTFEIDIYLKPIMIA
jgi:hypothetical protein